MGVPRSVWLASAASLAMLAASGVAHAQEEPAAETAEDAGDDESNEIVVLATRGDEVRIDRRTYTLRDDATAQSTNMYDVLGRIPSVSVSPGGDVTLLGASNVTIQINGQPVQGASLEQVLRGLPGSEVERIEVITNPSAQYSAQTSGGIINIITRQRFDSGFNGSIMANADSLGGHHFGVAPSWSRGQWALSGQVGTFGGENENDLERVRELLPAGPITSENGARFFDYNGWYASRLSASYRPTERRRLTLSVDAGEFNFESGLDSERFDAGGALLSTNTVRTDSANAQNRLSFEFNQDGDAPRELTKFELVLGHYTNESDTLFANTPSAGAVTAYATTSATETNGVNADLDIEQPLSNERFLTIGAAFERFDQTFDNALAPISGAAPLAYDSTLDATAQTLSGYATYQFNTGDWTWLPGLRIEAYWREISSGGVASDDDDTRAFPSLHIRNALTPEINIDLSYTSRIQRPGLQSLDPALRFQDVDRASSGNPNLQPSTTDAYEANIVYQKNGASFSLTFFDRISEDNFSQFTELTPDGIVLSMPVNAGTSEQRGLQAVLRGPLSERWRYSVSGNVLNREFDFISGGILDRRSEFEYDGNVQLDYRDPDQDQVGANQVQLDLRFQGPRFGLQSETDPFVTANFTWRRRLAPRLFGVFGVQDIFDSGDQITEIVTDDYIERAEFASAGTRVRLALTYQFGSGPQRPPQDQGMGGPPMPMQ
ncbi:MAG: TonB-dependent receptor plug domain-containing protein [Hyphomonadaceae bacterium]